MARHPKLLLSFALFLIFVLARSDDACSPQQIHLALGDDYYKASRLDDLWLPNEDFQDNKGFIIWLAELKCNFTIRIVNTNTSDETVKLVKTYDHYFHHFPQDNDEGGKYDQTAFIFSLENLVEYDSQYQYEILNSQDSTKLAGPFTFRLASPRLTMEPKKILLIGDTSLSERGNITINRLISEISAKSEEYAGLIHLGDISYNLEDNNGKKGDDFFQTIQNITASLPLIITPGNHDNFDHWDLLNFRTRNPLYSMSQNHYYSFNMQGIHFLSINFEYYNQAKQPIQEEIYSWIERDLNMANDQAHRLLWPWVVVISHHPIYCMYNAPNATEDKKCYSYFEEMKIWDALFHRYGVDLMVSAHLHSYERMKPINKNDTVEYTQKEGDINQLNIVNPTGTVFIIEGAGGNDQYFPLAYEPNNYGYVVDRNPGYGVLYATENSGEVRLRYEHYNSESGKMIDAMNIVKTQEVLTSSNTLDYILVILFVGCACLGLTVGFIKVRQWRQRNQEMEDNVPLNKDAMMSGRLRYNRPGQRGISMVDL